MFSLICLIVVWVQMLTVPIKLKPVSLTPNCTPEKLQCLHIAVVSLFSPDIRMKKTENDTPVLEN